MSEADAEDGLHGLDEPLATINDTRLNIEFAFHSDRFFLRRGPTEPSFRSFNFKKIPPRKRKSMPACRRQGKAETGRGRKRRVREVRSEYLELRKTLSTAGAKGVPFL